VEITLVDLLLILSPESKMASHACKDVSRTLHACESIWFASYLIMSLGALRELCDWWIMWLVNSVTYVKLCTWRCLLGYTCTLETMMLIWEWCDDLLMLICLRECLHALINELYFNFLWLDWRWYSYDVNILWMTSMFICDTRNPRMLFLCLYLLM